MQLVFFTILLLKLFSILTNKYSQLFDICKRYFPIFIAWSIVFNFIEKIFPISIYESFFNPSEFQSRISKYYWASFISCSSNNSHINTNNLILFNSLQIHLLTNFQSFFAYLVSPQIALLSN